MGGGAGGGKTWLICESRVIRSYQYPGYKSFIGREELTRLMGSTYLTFQKVLKHHGIFDQWKFHGDYHWLENLQTGARIDLLDLKYLPSDPLYERFGSLEYSDGAIDEAGEVDFLAYDVLKSRTNRHLNKELGIIPSILLGGNPKKNWTYELLYKPWKEGILPADTVFVQSLYKDNPHTAEDYGRTLAGIKDNVLRERLKEGNWEYDDDPNALVKYEAIVDMFTTHVDDGGSRYLVADIARYGGDKIVIMLWKGLQCYKTIVYEKQGIDTTANIIKQLLFSEEIPYSHCLVDEDGVGGGIVDILRGIKGFVANSQPVIERTTGKPANFANLKTQCAFLLADYINNHRIAIDLPDLKVRSLLVADLEQIKSKDIDLDGKRKIVPKDDVKEVLGRSPDYGDALMMRMFFELNSHAGQAATTTYAAPHSFTVPNVPNVASGHHAVVSYPKRR